MLWGISIFSFIFLRLDIIEAIFPLTASAASIGISLTIAMDCLMTFFGSSANDAAFNAWVTDSTDTTNRGAAEGINSMMPLVAILVVFGGFMFFDLEQSESWVWIFSIIGVAVFLIGLLGIFMIKEPPLKLLENVKGLEYIEMAHADRCCGFGGTFSFKQPVIAGEVVYEKCQTIIDTGANVICGADVPCLLNIKGALGRMRADGRLDRDIRVMHIAQILDSRG
ncbi:MAG: (Fe-S)-binding protein [Clostridia bacterium]|nr:(Fe-S)-binding protein [Clostridia bacterium]